MQNIVISVLFSLIAVIHWTAGYMPVYPVANQDLIKGILLGALLTSQKHPSQLLNYVPLPYYQTMQGHYMSVPSQYGNYPNPTQSPEQNQVTQEYQYRERPMDQENSGNTQQTMSQQQSGQQSDQPEEQSESRQQSQQQSESYYEPVMADPPTPQQNTVLQQSSMPVPSEPVVPSMESIQRNLGLPSHSVILMILPTAEDKQTETKTEPKKSNNTTKSESEQEFSEQHSIGSNGSETSIRTNAMKVGSKLLNPKGWKPVPKTIPSITTSTTTTSTTTEATVEQNNRFNRFNDNFNRINAMNRYVERSQFGLRNRDLDHYQRWDDPHSHSHADPHHDETEHIETSD